MQQNLNRSETRVLQILIDLKEDGKIPTIPEALDRYSKENNNPVTRQFISKTIQSLEDKGYVKVVQHHIDLLDLEDKTEKIEV